LDQTFLGLGKLFPARERLVSDIPAGDGNIAKPFPFFTVGLRLLRAGTVENCVQTLQISMSTELLQNLIYLREISVCKRFSRMTYSYRLGEKSKLFVTFNKDYFTYTVGLPEV